jgi:hypothetical protein
MFDEEDFCENIGAEHGALVANRAENIHSLFALQMTEHEPNLVLVDKLSLQVNSTLLSEVGLHISLKGVPLCEPLFRSHLRLFVREKMNLHVERRFF